MGPLQLTVMESGYPVYQSLPPPVQTVTTLQSYSTIFASQADGLLGEIYLPHLVDQSATPGAKTLQVSITPLTSAGTGSVSTGTVTSVFPMTSDGRGGEYLVKFDTPLPILKQNLYSLNIKFVSGTGNIAVYGSAPALESSWDDALPQPINGYGPFDYYNGIYQGDLNFEMYNDDNLDKLKRFETTLDEANYIFISSNRQWATTVRVPQRYPLTIDYYRNLLGCPADQSIIWCYSVAQPGMFTGNLGYKLVAVFQSNPNLGSIQINDQFAEEAFTVYDHPKVMIFEKEASYSSQTVRNILGAVDLSNVIHVTPREAGSLPPPPKTLMLSSSLMAEQTAGGTWSQLFDWNAIQNKYQAVGVIIWYLAVFLLGLLVYPLFRIAFPGLSDRGYPLARTAGLLLLSFLVWIGGSEGIPFTRVTITVAILILALIGGALAFYQRKQLKEEWRSKSRYFLMVEGLVLAFFVVDLLIRLGNPDLWHPYYGGEKPMDFSFFNAVIKSTTFPPYDPWFAGGYINYYYYGYVIVGVLVKWLGIAPSIAYNLILPTLFAMVAMGAFSFGWNIIQSRKRPDDPFQDAADPDPDPEPESTPDSPQSEVSPAAVGCRSGLTPLTRLKKIIYVESAPDPFSESTSKGERLAVFGHPFWIGLASSIGLLILGNLGTVRMIWQALQKLAAPGGNITDGSIFTHWLWSIQGFFVFLSGTGLPITTSDWYWVPSRAISTAGGNEITEFPFFTFIYADLHAHLIALGITILALIWALAIILGRAHWGEKDGKGKFIGPVVSLFLGALIIGSLRPTNTWDYPTYLAIGIVALVYTLWRYFVPRSPDTVFGLQPMVQRLLVVVIGAAALFGLSLVLFEPFTRWYGQAYEAFAVWTGGHTPFWSYLTQWGLFLFIIVTWMAWETYDWMKFTPMSSLVKLRPYLLLIEVAALILVGAAVYLTIIMKIQIAWVVIFLAGWAAVLIIRPGQADAKRAVLFMIGTALVLTLFVELFVLVGDIGRMNTVFKFYYQAWTLFALSAGAGFGWLIKSLPRWHFSTRMVLQTAGLVLVAGAALYPITAAPSKIRDRMAPNAPHTLDGMTYMAYSTYTDPGTGVTFQLNQDYLAIRWMQENVQGSPVIVEGNTPEYRWGSRFTIYTGLPGVVGWNWHERQQRASLPSNLVTDRIAEITNFYTTTNQQVASNFLQKYNVQYIIVGQLERAYYPGPGIDKFSEWNGVLWQQVYQDGQTAIYKVLR